MLAYPFEQLLGKAAAPRQGVPGARRRVTVIATHRVGLSVGRVMMLIRVLGPIGVRTDAGDISVGGHYPRAVLAVLALRRGEAVSVGRLVDSVWGDVAPDSVTNVLQVYVSRLRKVLGRDAIRTEGTTYLLTVPADAVDAAQFYEALANGRKLLADGRALDARVVLRRALACWEGPALGDEAGSVWLEHAAARLEEDRLAALEARIESDLLTGDASSLVTELIGLVESHPLREGLHRQLMWALYRVGRQAEALAAGARARDLFLEEFGLDPGPELRLMMDRILRQDPTLNVASTEIVVGSRAGSWTRASGGPTIGRDVEIGFLRDLLLSSEHRLVTVTGPGGVGKSHLARQVAAALDTTSRTVIFVELAGVDDPQRLVEHVSVTAGVRLVESTPKSLARSLVAGGDALLVLDNLEHLLPAAASVVAHLASEPGLIVLATSREPTGVKGEQRVPIKPLSLDATANASCSPAAALFWLRAQEIRPALARDEASEVVVERICSLLDGLPLAIELAAADIRLLAPEQILAGVERVIIGADDKTPAMAGLRPRLLLLVNASLDRCSASERALFVRLSVFRAGATLDAIEGVCSQGPDASVLEALAGLTDRSLVDTTSITPSGAVRFRLLEPLRALAAAQQSEAEGLLLRDRHADWYCDRFDRPDLLGRRAPQDGPAVAALEAERVNLEAAFSHSAGRDVRRYVRLALVLSSALSADPAIVMPALQAGTEILDDDDPLRPEVYMELALLQYDENDLQAAELTARIAVELAKRMGRKALECQALCYVFLLAAERGKTSEVDLQRLQDRIMELRRRSPPGAADHVVTGPLLGNLAICWADHHDLTQARRLFELGRRIAAEDGDAQNVLSNGLNLSVVLLEEERYELATATLQRMVEPANQLSPRGKAQVVMVTLPAAKLLSGTDPLEVVSDLARSLPAIAQGGNVRLMAGALITSAATLALAHEPDGAGLAWGAFKRVEDEHGEHPHQYQTALQEIYAREMANHPRAEAAAADGQLLTTAEACRRVAHLCARVSHLSGEVS
jgi:DNA-binding SARP family transcriptional activator/predicted ATPase